MAIDVDGLRASHAAFVAAAAALDDDSAAQPSLLPGWPRSMVIAHVASAGRAALRCAEAAAVGQPATMYPGGEVQRDAEIGAGTTTSQTDAVTELTRVCAALEDALSALEGEAWDVTMESRRGPISMQAVAVQRWMDVAAHHVDLGVGATAAAWPTALVDAALPVTVGSLPSLHRRPDADRSVRGAWRLQRTDGPGEWTLRADGDEASLADGGGATDADCTISGPGWALLTRALGRDDAGALEITGDADLVSRLKAVFPGP